MALGKGIPVINGFDLNSKLPLDSRTVADTKEEMNALVTNGSVGDGQLCYCKADKKMYVLKDNAWSEVGGGGKTYTLSITEVLDIKYVGEIYGYLTNSSESVGKIYPLLKDISDIINNYDSVFISTDDVGLNGGLLFHKQLDKLPTTFSITYGYFWYATSSLGVFDFSTICVSLINDKLCLGIISNEHLLPKYDNATEGQVLTITRNNRPRWTTPTAVPTITFED